MRYEFDWDPVKARQNLKKHGVSFERAARIFLDPFAISIFDEKHSASEDRKKRNNIMKGAKTNEKTI